MPRKLSKNVLIKIENNGLEMSPGFAEELASIMRGKEQDLWKAVKKESSINDFSFPTNKVELLVKAVNNFGVTADSAAESFRRFSEAVGREFPPETEEEQLDIVHELSQ